MIIKLYDYFDFLNYCWCGVGMGDNDAPTIGRQIDQAVRDKEDIEVHINSGGGFVYDGFNIYNALVEASKLVNVTTVNMGIAASIASIVFMAGKERKMAKASLAMVHKPSIDMFYYGSMNADDLKREAAALDQIQAVLTSIYVDATGLDEAIVNDMINSETWLTPFESELNNFCTEIIGSKSDKANVAEAILNNIQKSAPENIKKYANRFFNSTKITPEMNKEFQDSIKEQNTLMKSLKTVLNKVLGDKKPKNETLTLSDGTILYLDVALSVDAKVFTDEEMTIPVDDGTYELTDGSTFTTVDGVVTEITEAEAEANAENNNDAPTIESLEARVAALETENIALKSENKSLKASNTAALNSVKSANKLMKELTQTASNYKAPEAGTTFSNSTKEDGKEKPKFINTKKKLKTT